MAYVDHRRLNAFIADHTIALKEEYTGYTNNQSHDTIPPRGLVLVSDRDKKAYTPYTDDTIWRKIHSDPLLKRTQEWGMSARMVKGFIEEYGLSFVKEVVKRVSERHDSYFYKPEPKTQQRGKLCRHIITEEGVPIR